MRKDIDFNFIPHPLTGDLTIKKDVGAIDQSIKNLVFTNYYERGFNIDIGGNVMSALFENITPLLKQDLKDSIKQVLTNFEPAVELIDVEVSDTEPNTLVVNIFYYINNDIDVQRTQVILERPR